MNARVQVSCRLGDDDAWTCEVQVGDDPRATMHIVTVSAETLQRLHPGASDPTSLVTASFGFLLERESRESILRTFDLPVIERYFPGYGAEIGRRLAD